MIGGIKRQRVSRGGERTAIVDRYSSVYQTLQLILQRILELWFSCDLGIPCKSGRTFGSVIVPLISTGMSASASSDSAVP